MKFLALSLSCTYSGNRISSLHCVIYTSYDLYQVLFAVDLEWDLADQQLVSEYSYGPDIHLLVVLAAHNELWRAIYGAEAEGGSVFVLAVDGPAEVAHLGDALNKR